MKLLFILFVACMAAAQALPRSPLLTPRVVEFPEWTLNPRLTGWEWEAIRRNNEPQPEKVADYRPGTEPQSPNAGMSYSDSKIIGGSNAVPGEFPWQASLTMDGSFFCGGSIISEGWVLTAAHCAVDVKSFSLVFGSLDPDGDSGSVHLTSRKGITHEKYDAKTTKNDIALVELPSKLTFNSRVSPVRLPSKSQASETFVGKQVVISGWGRTSDAATGISTKLKHVTLEVITNTVCANTFGSAVTAGNICCKTDKTHATCNGDSGGPLVHKESDGLYTEVGIVSFGAAAGCEKGYPDVFTRVTYFLDWISTHSGVTIRR